MFDGLSAEDKALVTNADKLTAKIEELTAVMGVTPDFTKTFAEHYPEANNGGNDTTEPEDTTDVTEPNDGDTGLDLIYIILIAVGATVVVAGIVVGVVLIIKNNKKRSIEE